LIYDKSFLSNSSSFGSVNRFSLEVTGKDVKGGGG
jgi:hypothetical protein